MPYDKDKKKKVQRLVDVDVSHVSLVDRPANMTPFKAVKREDTPPKGANPMNITLKNLFGSRAAAVLSVMAVTEAKATAVAKHLIDGEFTVTETDGVFLARKNGVPVMDDEQIVHLGKRAGVAYSVAHLQKGLAIYDMETENFDDALAQEGFVPGIFVGMDALHTMIRNIAMSDEVNTAEMFSSKVGEAIDDFKKYMGDMIAALPEKAFKFEKALVAVAPNELKNPGDLAGGFNTDVYDAIFGPVEPAPADEAPKEAAPAASAAPEGEDKAKTEEAPVAAPEAATEAPKVEAAPANLEELPKSAKETDAKSQEQIMGEMLDALTKNVGGAIAEALAPINERLGAQDAAIQKMSKAVGGAVLTTPEADSGNVVDLNKSESRGTPPLMDTAYAKRG